MAMPDRRKWCAAEATSTAASAVLAAGAAARAAGELCASATTVAAAKSADAAVKLLRSGIDAESQARIDAIAPVIQAKVIAGSANLEPHIDSATRARRKSGCA